MARRECRCRLLGYDTLGNTWRPERRLIDLFRRSDPCECIRCSVVCRLSGREHRRRLSGARGRADATCRGLAASDTVTGVNRPTDCLNAADNPIKADTMPTLVLPLPLIQAACKATLLTLPR